MDSRAEWSGEPFDGEDLYLYGFDGYMAGFVDPALLPALQKQKEKRTNRGWATGHKRFKFMIFLLPCAGRCQRFCHSLPGILHEDDGGIAGAMRRDTELDRDKHPQA